VIYRNVLTLLKSFARAAREGFPCYAKLYGVYPILRRVFAGSNMARSVPSYYDYRVSPKHVQQATPQELSILLRAFNRLATTFESFSQPEDVGFRSRTFNDIIFSLPRLRDPIRALISSIDLEAAQEGNKEEMWKDEERSPKIDELFMVSCRVLHARRLTNSYCIQMLEVVHTELRDELAKSRPL
jgi:hypothetical protein